MNCKVKYIIGVQPYLQWAMSAWQELEPETELRPIELEQDKAYKFNLDQLDSLSKENATAFVAQDAQFLNFRRYELMAELKSRGFSMPPLISKGAIVARSARVSESSWVGLGAILGHGCSIGFNCVIGAGANIGNGVKIGNSTWIDAGVLIGHNAKIGSNTTLGQGVIVSGNIEVERLVVIDKPGKISVNVPAKTFVHGNFDGPIIIVEPPYL